MQFVLLRWALVEEAWRLVGNSPKWAALFSRLIHRSGKKRAIVAVARKLLCVLYAYAQDVDSVQDRNHADHDPPDNWQEVGQDIDSGPDHNHGDHGSSDNPQGLAEGVAGRYITRMFTILHPPMGPREEERYA